MANQHISNKVSNPKENRKYSIDYDKEMDILYLHVIKPAIGYESELSNNVFLRKSFKDNSVIGAVIYDTSKTDLTKDLQKLPFDVSGKAVKKYINSIQ